MSSAKSSKSIWFGDAQWDTEPQTYRIDAFLGSVEEKETLQCERRKRRKDIEAYLALQKLLSQRCGIEMLD
jgi:hypothetical protein